MIEPTKLPLGVEAEAKLCRFLQQRLRALFEGLRDIHTNRVVKWRKAYEAVPATATREFPFFGASNLVVPIIAIHSDTLLARIMSAVFKTRPLWVASPIEGAEEIPQVTELRGAIEEFLQFVALEPTLLDLYRVYHEWFGETIRYGTSVIKMPHEKILLDRVVPAGDGSGKFEYVKEVKYEGPRPVKIPFQDFLISPTSKTLEAADFKAHRIRLQKQDLEERAFRGIYDKEKVKAILKQPDLTSPDYVQQQAETDMGARTSIGYGWAEWHIYECHAKYRTNGRYVEIICWYHEKTNTLLRAYFNYYPMELFVGARLFYRDDSWFGYGFCERLAAFQEELSQIHNGRRDNVIVANTRVWRVDPDSALHKGYRIFPSAMLPARKDEIEPLLHGEVSQMTIEEERLSLELAEKLSGVSAPQQGMGAGTNSKRGVYTAMGTLSLLQEGNTRTDLNVSDMRYAHTKLGRILASEYAEFGINPDIREAFGKRGKMVEAALQLMKKHQLILPIQSSTASVNREVEKQNDLMLVNVMNRHYQMVAQMLGAAQQMMTPDNVKKYIADSIESSNALMKSVLRHFDQNEVDRLVPEAKPAEQGQGGGPPPPQAQGPPNGAAAGGMPPGGPTQ